MPATTFVFGQKQLDSCSLEDDVELTGRIIARFSYKNTEIPVDSWVSMMEQLLKILHTEDASVLTKLAYNNDTEDELSAYVSNDPNKLRGAMYIESGIYVERNTSTAFKISMLRKFFKAYSIDPEELIFYLKDDVEDTHTDELGTRYELRRRYWSFALPMIQQVHGNYAFSNCVSTKDNMMPGFFGIGGFVIGCIANYNEARVEIRLGKPEREINKEAFDYLHGFRMEIEAALGTALEWLRNDDSNISKIAVKLSDVSLDNESDWTWMAKFHAEWSKKFYDVIVPHLKNKY